MNVAGRADRARGRRATGFVAGSVGPLNITLSLSPQVDDPGFRTHTFEQVVETYAEQIRGLADGGVDLLLIETIFDTLNCKAAIAAAREVAPQLPLWISVTIVDLSGRTLSGQTIEAFWTAIEHAEPLIVGINCSLGATEMRPYVADLARIATCLTSCHPNAGLPNAFGGYDETPEITSTLLREFAQDGLLNVVGSLLRLDARAHARDRRGRARARAANVPIVPVGANAVQRPGAVRDRPRHRLRPDRRAHERHRLRALPPPGRGAATSARPSTSRSSRCAAARTCST